MDPPNLPLLLLLMLASAINAQYFPAPYCGSTGNFTADSTYQTALTTLLSSISTTNSLSLTYGFFNASSAVSGTSQTLYVIGSCRGDLTAESCRACLDASASDIRRLCPLQREAVLYSENCTVRYSNALIFGTVTTDPGYQLSNVNDVTSPDTYNAALRSLLDGLQAKAAGGGSLRKYATGDAPVGLYTIYAMEQCTPDLTEQNCNNCLATVFRRLVLCCAGKMGVNIMAPSCQLRYETNAQFFDPVGEPLPSPPPVTPPRKADAPPSPPGSISKSLRIVVAVASSAVLLVMVIVSMFCFIRRRRTDPLNVPSVKEEVETAERLRFTLSEIRAATNVFSEGNKIGEGGFGKVYRGTLENGQYIAVKRLEGCSIQGEQQFKNEATLMARLQHKNLIKLQGYCMEEGERILILELAHNASLEGFIADSNKRVWLSWQRRFSIIKGIAQGLLYLHEESRLRIIHRDLKPGNVLLDNNMNPKISDFGTARLFDLDQSRERTAHPAGTFGYMAPEYVRHGEISVKTDVYSFGVVALEIISGKKNSYFSSSGISEHLLSYAWKNWRKGTPFRLIDPMLSRSSRIEMSRCIHVALLCVQENVGSRPTMASVVLMLGSESAPLPTPARPAYLMDPSVRDMSTSSVSGPSTPSTNEAQDGSTSYMISLSID